MRRSSRVIPSVDQVWSTVSTYARRCKAEGIPIHTLQRSVSNMIDHVGENVIKRVSTGGRKQTAHITRRDVERVWLELVESKNHESSTKGSSRVFTHALMLAAMGNVIEPRGLGTIGLKGYHLTSADLPTFAREEVGYAGRAVGRRGHAGEGPIHRGIRLYIHEQPNSALVGLSGGPWTPFATEYTLATQDRIDVVVRDNDGLFVLIEVKPELASDDWYKQASSDKPIARRRMLRPRNTVHNGTFYMKQR